MREHLVIDMFLGGAVVRCTEGSFRFLLVLSPRSCLGDKLTDMSEHMSRVLAVVERGRNLHNLNLLTC